MWRFIKKSYKNYADKVNSSVKHDRLFAIIVVIVLIVLFTSTSIFNNLNPLSGGIPNDTEEVETAETTTTAESEPVEKLQFKISTFDVVLFGGGIIFCYIMIRRRKEG